MKKVYMFYVDQLKHFFLRILFRKEYRDFKAQLQDFSAAYKSSRILREHYSLPKNHRFAYNHEAWITCPACQEIYDAKTWGSCPVCKTKPF